jgi:hypothetical protein
MCNRLRTGWGAWCLLSSFFALVIAIILFVIWLLQVVVRAF